MTTIGSRAIPKVRYRVLVGLDYPTNRDAIRRILAGEQVPFADRGMKRAEPGDIVTDLPDGSIAGLLAKGRIELVTEEEVSDGGSWGG